MATTTRDFHHPYTPYSIQNDLMNAIYECIAEKKIGVFESPTGTGKSLSLICGSLTWLRDHQEETLQTRELEEDDQEEPAWVREHAEKEKKQALYTRRAEVEARLTQIRAKEARQRKLYEKGESEPKRFKKQEDDDSPDPGDEAFELDDYESDDDKVEVKASGLPSDQGLSSASLQMMEKLGLVLKPSPDDELLPIDETKIFYCSRTHSQLTQFAQELGRVNLPGPSWATPEDTEATVEMENKVEVKHLPLGSRKNLCINPRVSKLGSVTAVNERCLELQQPKTAKDHKCLFVPKSENQALVNEFRDHTLAKIRDIEDLGTLGKKIGICPYYASRATIKPSEIVTLPYPLLLQKSAREALGLSLKDHVVIIDEAHNLMDTISSIHSISISQSQLKRCRAQLGVYLQKYRNRLKGKNRVYIAQLVRLIDSVSSYLDTQIVGNGDTEGPVKISDFMAGKGVDQVNLYKLMHYLQESKLARKVEGYANHIEELNADHTDRNGQDTRPSTMPVLTHVQSFLQTLTNPAAEGRFFYEKEENGSIFLKYMLLDPTHHFKEIVEDARSVILAGGTMSPMDDYTRHLFPYLSPSRLVTWSCGHIIPPENLLALPITHGPSNDPFDFTYTNRTNSSMLTSLGQTILTLTRAVPDGLIVFFSSYAYLDHVVQHWKTHPLDSKDPKTTTTIWSALSSHKPIFLESKSTTPTPSSNTDTLLASYSLSISTSKSGLLLSVISGKLSEGINFSDALGRGVAVIGLPYPNMHSPEWQAKLEHVTATETARTGSRGEGKRAAREFYENACMRAVNQCVGRAIRHRGDYAGIFLVDQRFGGERITGKLPGWIRRGMVGGVGWEGLEGRVRGFFEGRAG